MDDMILASSAGTEERVIDYPYDIEVGGSNTFELSIPISDWKSDLTYGKRIYIPGTEYGGIIQAIESDTSKDTIFVRGYTWRGYLDKKYVRGTYTGGLNTIISSMLGGFTGVFLASGSPTAYGSITLSSFTSIADALDALLTPIGYKLQIRYVQTATSGYAELAAVPSGQYGDEVSQDNLINFSVLDDRMSVNHLIVSNGTTSADVYADKDGNISTTQTLFGIDEIADIYKVTGSSDLVADGKDKIKDMISKRTMTATFGNADDIELDIGDLVTGRDYVTGITVTRPITGKIVTYQDGELSIAYSIDEEGRE